MYIELLEKLTEKIKYAKLQTPCSDEDIIKTEEHIGHKFPLELKILYLETNGDNFLLLSLEHIKGNVSLNREYLRDLFETEEEYSEKIDNFIFFATNGCGDYYCYKVLENGEIDCSGLYIWEHETFEARIVAENLTDLIIKYYNDEI